MANTNGWTHPNIKMIHNLGILKVDNNGSTFSNTLKKNMDSLILTVTAPNGVISKFNSTIISNNGFTAQDEVFSITLTQSGEYKLEFELKWNENKSTGNVALPSEHYTVTATTYIYVNPEDSDLKPYSLGDTIRRVLNLTPTRTVDEPPKYTFDPVQLAEYDKEESPEFSFTGHTLFEALLMIAQYKGAFPQLDENGVISFRKLWNDKYLTEAELPPPIDEISCSDINQYCTYLDTEVQNLVGVNDSQTGSIVEPYEGGYKTTRAESGSEISQDTAIISTDYSQYLHIKEEIGYIDGIVPTNNDLTAYVYESGDYYALTDKAASYPASKAYALQWMQMGQNITELTHRTKAESGLVEAFYQPAIANIIQAKTGMSYDTGIVAYICSLINPNKNAPSVADLMFRTTYIPVINSRIKQYKENFANFHYDGSLKYNQTAELVDSELYGEHLKQLIRKIGNSTKRKIYIFDRIDLVPKVGTVVDGYSVYDVQMSIRENKVIATVSYVKYAELSQYIGVKNPWKDSDVSIDKCYNRAISYNEFLLFTHIPVMRGTSFALSSVALNGLVKFTSANALTCVEATGHYIDGSPLNTVLLPVVSLAVGNSILFQWGYQNNYSAGYMSETAPEGATNVISGTKYNRAQKAVKYCDMYGRMETYDFKLMRNGPVPKGSNIGWQNSDGEIDYSSGYVSRQIGHSLPLKPTELVGWVGEAYISVSNLLVQKNSSEALTFSVQLHYCSEDENFIVGSGLTNFCSLVGGEAQEVALFGFNERINIFNRRPSVKEATNLLIPIFTVSASKITINLPDSINNYQAWAYMGKDKNGNWQIIFGENRDFKGSDFETELYLLPMHKLEDFV